jgi:hypothetical protein
MSIFGISFSLKDAIRSAWTFAAAFTAVMVGYGGDVDEAALWAAAAAGLVAVKNLLLADGSTAKG